MNIASICTRRVVAIGSTGTPVQAIRSGIQREVMDTVTAPAPLLLLRKPGGGQAAGE